MLHFFNIFNHVISSESATHGESESIGGIIIHHLGDYLIEASPIRLLNEGLLSQKLFGIFDMRITKVVLMLWLTAILCLLIFIPVSRILRKETNHISKSRWVNFWEMMISFVHDNIVSPNFEGHYIKKAMPYFCTLFFFIFFSNLIGLIPGLKSATGNLAVTAGLSILTLFGIFGVGFIRQGPIGYIRGLVPHGVPVFIMPLLIPIEIIGIFIKVFALTIRLFANMTGGHIVILIFLYLIIMFQRYWVGVPAVTGALMINLMELLIAFLQAYIFTMLSAMFIGASMHSH